ncbi:DUF892 family protein [Chitinophaga horti]|uniref:DUF892 family protein n=1 Tax=Chitinophaga horti TaxID=2920382 RepID=A0ABY6J7G7_9BACT|nr:DUF892 family protein [Chitinophaga horti]UYQ95629.1 DUF892 family protein [Chitinophaga horti]
METLTGNVVDNRLELFFSTMLKEVYWAEQNLVNVLTTMQNAATNPELAQAFGTHRAQTEKHVKVVEEVFEAMGLPAEAERCAGLQGLFDEGWKVIDETEDGTAQRDVALIIAAQKVEHYEIACYGSLCTLAITIGQTEIAKKLRKVLNEEKETDALLTIIAESKINAQASEETI